MRKSMISYDSIVDALVAVSKRLSSFEDRYQMASEDFYYKFKKGQLSDDSVFSAQLLRLCADEDLKILWSKILLSSGLIALDYVTEEAELY